MVDDRQLQTQWYRVCSRLRTEIGESAFENWVTPIKVFGFDGSEVNLTVPSRFMRDWVLANYLDRLKELWNGENSSVQSIALSIQPSSTLTAENRETVVGDMEGLDASQEATKVKPVNDWHSNGRIAAPLDPKFTFDQFVVGKPNEFAYAAARRVAEALSVPFNPLFLYGGVGLGKTHLMNAIAWEIVERDPSRTIMYLSAEKFMYRFVRALREQSTVDFRVQFRSVDVLMIDDAPFIEGRDAP